MIGLISFVVIFSILIFAHELGHFLSAKLCGVRVEEFGFGYPPRLARLGTWRGTAITVNVLPFGGFVRMAENDPSVAGGLANRRPVVRALVFVSGALMNMVLAVMLFSATFVLGNLTPTEAPGAGVYYVAPGSPADLGGLLPGDNIIAIDGHAIAEASEASRLIKAKLGQALVIELERGGQALAPISLVPRVSPPPNEGALGVALDLPLTRKSYPVWQAVPMGFRATYQAGASLFMYLRAAIRRQASLQLSGPLGIAGMTREVAKSGLVRLVEFAGFLSINLAIFQLFPLPALDGGHLLFVLIEWVRGGRRVPPEKEGVVHAVGMVILIGLMVVVSVFDYMRYFG